MLRMKKDEAKYYFPRKGITFRPRLWNHNRGLVIAEFESSDLAVFVNERKDKDELDIEVYHHPYLKGRVVQDFGFNYVSIDVGLVWLAMPRRDMILDDVIISNMPRGTRHKITNRHKVRIDEMSEGYYASIEHAFRNIIGTSKQPESREFARIGSVPL